MTQRIDGNDYTWLAREDGKPGMLLPSYARDKLVRHSRNIQPSDLNRIALIGESLPRDEERAPSILALDDRPARVLQRLEALFLRAIYDDCSQRDYDPLSPAVTLPTAAAKTAAEWLFGFFRMTRSSAPDTGFSPPALTCKYTIGANEFGETLHIFACNTLLKDYVPLGGDAKNKPKLGWTVSGGDANATVRCNNLLGGASTVSGNIDSTQKTDMNRYLLGPLLVKNPLDGHARILRDLLPARHADIGTAVRRELKWNTPKKGDTAPRESVGIWIRASTSNTTTNTTLERFNQFAKAVPPGHGIMLLGDEPAAGLKKEIATKWKDRAWLALYGLGSASWLAAAQGTAGPVLYQSQASALVHLYRDHGLYCIIGNKSGGMDLPAFASIPSIQFSPDPIDSQAKRLYQRLVFTSLCSPFWRIISVNGPSGAPSDNELSNAIAAAADTKAAERARPTS